MTPKQIRLVQESWKKVLTDTESAADKFYEILFDLAPQLRNLFPDVLKEHKVKLFKMIHVGVRNLDCMDLMVDPLRSLGEQHAGYGAELSHYTIVGNCFLLTLEDRLKSDFTPEVEEAWSAAYKLLSDLMIEGAKKAEAA